MKKTMLTMLWRTLTVLLIILLILVAAIAAFTTFAPTFGGSPNGDSLYGIEGSPNYQDGGFVNLVATAMSTGDPDKSMNISGYLFPPDDKNPATSLPSVEFEKSAITSGDFVWFGHSTILFKTSTLNILTDPVFNRASPVPLVGNPFEYDQTPVVENLPDIDVVLISHDHYDHLDHIAIGELATSTKQFLVPLGIKAHLLRWGVAAKNIIELDWYQSVTVGTVSFTLTPSRHFSGRGITNRNSTLWGSWVVQSPSSSVFFSGDSGYFEEFKRIGDSYGPFDIAFIENGAYDESWDQIHMMPEDSAQAALDLNAALFFPIHWGKFDLAQHNWHEPIERASVAAAELGVQIVTPMVGEVFTLDSAPSEKWWELDVR